MIGDYQGHHSAKLRTVLSTFVAPLHAVVAAPVRVFDFIADQFILHQHLLEKNKSLENSQLVLQAKLQRLLALEQENDKLRSLLKSASQAGGKVMAAQLVAVDLAPFRQEVEIDKGGHDGVYLGQPVLDAAGVMGQVIEVNSSSSRVLLIADAASAVPVQDNRSGVRTVALGLGYTDRLQLINVPQTADIQEGDVLVTSGLGKRFPMGYPVGVVTSKKIESSERFTEIMLKPSAHIDQSRHVLLVWPKQEKAGGAL